MPYNSQYTPSIASLLLRQGDIAADRSRASSEGWAQGLGALANVATTAINNRDRDRELAPQRQLQALQVSDATRKLQHDATISDALNKYPDLDQAADYLDSINERAAAHGIRVAGQQAKDAQVTGIGQRVDAVKTDLGKAATLAQEIQKNPSAYPALRPRIMEITQPFGFSIPETYDPEAVSGLFNNVTGAIQQVDQAHAADTAAQETSDRRKNGQASAEEIRQRVAGYVATARSPQDLAATLARLGQKGYTPDELAEFSQYSPDLPQRALEASLKREDLAKLLAEREKDAAKAGQDPVGQAGISDHTKAFLLRQSAAVANNGGQPLSGQERQDLWDDTAGSGPSSGSSARVPEGNWDIVGPDFLKTIPPPSRKTVEGIANYLIDPTKAVALRGDRREMYMQWVLQVNPDYDVSQFASRAPMRKNFTSGPQSQAINSLNTAIGHLDQFVSVAKTLGNGSFQPTNELTNWVRTTFGDSAPTNFEGIKSIMAGELASAFKKSGATDQEISSVERAISSKASAKQLTDYATTIAIPALGSKIASYNSQFRQVMGDRDPFKVLTPEAEQVLQKYGVDPSHPAMGTTTSKPAAAGFTVTAPNGKTYSFASQQALDDFKRKAGL